MRSGWRRSKLCKSAHPGCAGRAGQVVYAEMKRRVPIGHGPLDGDWRVASASGRAQKKWRLYVVVIRDGDQSRQLEVVFNLPALKVEGHARRQWRRPVTCRVIQINAMNFPAVAFAVGKDGTKDLEFGSQVGEKVERLF